MTTSPYAMIGDLTVAFVAPAPHGAGEVELMERQRTLAEIRRRVDAAAAANSAEIARLSAPELGHHGMAQSRGARTPAILVQQLTGVSAREANAMLRVGALLEVPVVPDGADSGTEPCGPVWLADVAAAVRAGSLSVEAAAAIQAGLGMDDTVEASALTEAAGVLLREAVHTPVDRLAVRARNLRAESDLTRVAERAEALREQRYLRFTPQSDGMTRVSGLLDPESAAIVTAAYDAATSPRRGGPRFVDPTSKARAEQITDDTRSTEQIAVDTFVQLIDLATKVDPDKILGSKQPPVQVLVTAKDLVNGVGVAFLEGQGEVLPVSTAERQACISGILPIQFDDDGQSLRLGRTVRTFTDRQRKAIAARDGGCLIQGCSRPPSWCEAHHLNEWLAHHGLTDVEDGVLLCTHHHLWLHNTGHLIHRQGAATYVLIPPSNVDPERTPIPLPSKSRVLDRLKRTA